MRSGRTRGLLAIALSALLHAAMLARLPAPGAEGRPSPDDGSSRVALAFAQAAPAPQAETKQQAAPATRQSPAKPPEQAAAVQEPTRQERRKTEPRRSQSEKVATMKSTETTSSESAERESTDDAHANAETESAATPAEDGGKAQAQAQADGGGQSEAVVIREPRFRRPPDPPVYPRAARRRGQEGVVLVRARLDTTGDVERIEIMHSSGISALDEAAREAVRGWAFEPYRRNGRTMTAWVELPVKFELR